MQKYITIIGSRIITDEEYYTLKNLASTLHGMGYVLRSGGADGADSTISHLLNIEVYIPWNGFNNLYHNGKTVFELSKLPNQDLAKSRIMKIHPAPQKLTQGALKLHTRNIYQVIGFRGIDGVKSEMVIYCADEGNDFLPKGGTRTAIAYAKQLNIPVYNIRNGANAQKIVKAAMEAIGPHGG